MSAATDISPTPNSPPSASSLRVRAARHRARRHRGPRSPWIVFGTGLALGIVVILVVWSVSVLLPSPSPKSVHNFVQYYDFNVTSNAGIAGFYPPNPCDLCFPCPSGRSVSSPIFSIIWSTTDGSPVSYVSLYAEKTEGSCPWVACYVVPYNSTNSSTGGYSAYTNADLGDGASLCGLQTFFKVGSSATEVTHFIGTLVYNESY